MAVDWCSELAGGHLPDVVDEVADLLVPALPDIEGGAVVDVVLEVVESNLDAALLVLVEVLHPVPDLVRDEVELLVEDPADVLLERLR